MYRLFLILVLVSYVSAITTTYTTRSNTGLPAATLNGNTLCASQRVSSSLTYLVDTTGSMSDDLNQLKLVNSWILDRLAAKFPCGVRQYTMVEFNDPYIGPVRITQSMKEFGDFFSSLTATGGGDCPELAMGGLELALRNSPPKSFILVLTDASASDYGNTALINRIRSLINTTKSQVIFLITGICNTIDSPDYLIYRDIASLSFGHVFQVSISDIYKVFNYLDYTLSMPVNSSSQLFSGDFTALNHSDSFSVTNNFTSFVITTNGLINSLRIVGPNLTSVDKLVSELWGSMMLVKKPNKGNWTITVNAGGSHSVRVEGFTATNTTSNCSKCHPNAICEVYFGSVQCSCKDGFIGDGFTCSDIDECAYSWTNNCSFGICKNTFGSYTCVCPSGYYSSGNNCFDINECSSPGLNRCHSLATCINYIGYYSCVCPNGYFGDGYNCELNECTPGVCGLGMECVKTNRSYFCSEPCSNHTLLNEPWRSTFNPLPYTGYAYNCDISKNGWYCFIGSGGVRMPETCISPLSCGTHAPVWLNGLHPALSDGIVNRTVCASWSGNCCLWSSTIQIKVCPGGYYVYKLSGTPSSACSLSYCTDPTTANVTCAADEDLKLGDKGYGCYCKDKYKVSAFSEIRPELTCGTNDMKATFHKCQMKYLNLNISKANFKDSSCFGFQDDSFTNSFSVLSTLQAGKCGVQSIQNATHITYVSNHIISLEVPGIITRNETLTISLSCVYPLDMMTSLNLALRPIMSSTNISIGGTGQFAANMALYKDRSYVSPYEGSEIVLSSQSILFIGVFIQGGDTSKYAVVMKNCYATPTAYANDTVKYYIIKNSCSNKQDVTINVQENGISRQGRVSLQMFKFVGDYNLVYLHCAVGLCDMTSSGCTPACSGVGARSAEQDIQTHDLRIGPITRSDIPASNNLNLSSYGAIGVRSSWAFLLSALLLLTLAVIQ